MRLTPRNRDGVPTSAAFRTPPPLPLGRRLGAQGNNPKTKMNPALQISKYPGRTRLAGSVLLAAYLAVSGLRAQDAAAPAAASTDGEVVKLSPFTVSTQRDYGYRASNSIAGTRTDTPIKDIPINIQV